MLPPNIFDSRPVSRTRHEAQALLRKKKDRKTRLRPLMYMVCTASGIYAEGEFKTWRFSGQEKNSIVFYALTFAMRAPKLKSAIY